MCNNDYHRVKVLGTTVNLHQTIEHIIANYEEAIKHLVHIAKDVTYCPYYQYVRYAREYAEVLGTLSDEYEQILDYQI